MLEQESFGSLYDYFDSSKEISQTVRTAHLIGSIDYDEADSQNNDSFCILVSTEESVDVI